MSNSNLLKLPRLLPGIFFLIFLTSVPLFAANDPTGDLSADELEAYYRELLEESKAIEVFSTPKTTQQMKTASREEIEKSNPQSVTDILTRQFSLSVNQNGPHGNLSGVNIRGFSGSRILILIDGIPMNSPQSGDFDLSMIPVSDIERIELIEGGSDTKYNFSGAIGGIINIITRKKTAPGIEIRSSFSTLFYYPSDYYTGLGTTRKVHRFSEWFDFFDTQKLSFSFGIGNETVRWKLSGTGTRAGNHFIFLDPDDIKRRRTDNEVWDAGASTELALNLPLFMKLSVSGSFFFADKNIAGLVNSTNTGHQTDIQGGTVVSFDADKVGLDNIDTEAQMSYQFKQLNWKDGYGDDVHRIHRLFAVNRWGFIITNWLKLSAGGDFSADFLDSTALGPKTLLNGGGYLTAEFTAGRIAKIIPSIKLIYTPNWPLPIPKLGAVFFMGEYFTLKTNIYRVFRLPSMNDLWWPSDSFAEGNPDLLPEDGVGGDIILGFSRKGILTAESSIHATWHKDAILWQPDGAKWKPSNIGQTFLLGSDHSVKSSFSKYFSIHLDYRFLLTWVLSEGFSFESDKRLPYKPVHTFGLGADVNWNTGTVGIKTRFESERFSSTLNVGRLDPFFTVDFDFTQNVGIVTLFASLKNAFNFYYSLIDGYPMPGGSFETGIRIHYEKEFKKP